MIPSLFVCQAVSLNPKGENTLSSKNSGKLLSQPAEPARGGIEQGGKGKAGHLLLGLWREGLSVCASAPQFRLVYHRSHGGLPHSSNCFAAWHNRRRVRPFEVEDEARFQCDYAGQRAHRRSHNPACAIRRAVRCGEVATQPPRCTHRQEMEGAGGHARN